MLKCGLIGGSLKHSYSAEIHKRLSGDAYSYRLIELSENEIESFINSEIDAFNVTIPYKKTVMKFLDHMDISAELCGAVNTVVREKNDGNEKAANKKSENISDGRSGGSLKSTTVGYNTDFQGFKYLLEANGIEVFGKEIFILGDGGTTATVKAVLSFLHSGRVIVVSRRGEVDYENYMNFSENAAVLINASPVGMYPENGKCSIDLAHFKNLEAVVDVVYNPIKTRLIFLAEERGIKCCSGLQMLVAQAKFAAELFTGKSIENDGMESITQAIISEKKNIVLIGMPGAGKSSVGRAVATASGREFIDTDEEIIRQEGASIPSIFEKKGEKYFREREIFAVGEAGKLSGKVISTGGGVVLNRENYYSLKQNSVVIYLKRELKFLETSGRPLSAKLSLKELFDARDGLYKNFADYEIENDGKISGAAKKIIDICLNKSKI
jgi:shikimate dehydrogenase